MQNIDSTSCPICSSKELKHFLECEDFYATHEVFTLKKCSSCQFILTDNAPNEKDIDKYYKAENYISHTDTDKGLFNKLYHYVREVSLKSKVKLIHEFAVYEDKGLLVDIGSGTGYFLDAMRDKHWLVTGIEKNEGARKVAKHKFDIDTQPDSYFYEIPPAKKDVVTMWHVLEHIENLDKLLTQVYNVLTPVGTFVVAIPNTDSYDAHYYKKFWAAYDVPRHLWHFNKSNFEKLANKYNFEIIATKPMLFDGFYISMLSEQYKKSFLASIQGLTKGFWFYLKTLFHSEKASSTIYILKKKV